MKRKTNYSSSVNITVSTEIPVIKAGDLIKTLKETGLTVKELENQITDFRKQLKRIKATSCHGCGVRTKRIGEACLAYHKGLNSFVLFCPHEPHKNCPVENYNFQREKYES